MINLHPEKHKFNSSSNLNLKRSSTGIRKLGNVAKPLNPNKSAQFLGSDLDGLPESVTDSRAGSFSGISTTAKSVSFATELKFTPDAIDASEGA
ncbi:UNVERIFIED_CONTAM: hypothetical protein HDU68_002857, partial [Siphonaria sp. JEL0065]